MIRLPFNTVDDVQDNIYEIARHLDDGGLIAYPTETVYGFGSLTTPEGLDALAALKRRDASKPVLVLDADPLNLDGLYWNDAARLLAEHFWPGPLTIALRADESAFEPPVLSQHGTVGVRQTPLPTLEMLVRLLAQPITSTSANVPGGTPARSADEAERALQLLHIDNAIILDGGPIPAMNPSTVIECSTAVPRVVRAGAVPTDKLRDILAQHGLDLDDDTA